MYQAEADTHHHSEIDLLTVLRNMWHPESILGMTSMSSYVSVSVC